MQDGEKDDVKNEIKSEIAQHKQRDSEGHFVHTDPPQSPASPQLPQSSQSPVEKFLEDHTHYDKSRAIGSEAQARRDDLLDVHVGNPLRRISQLLEDIKRQKAFSFTLKGSLGLAGVALALGVFGIFGGGRLLCEKGIQSEIGTIHVLNTIDSDPSTIPFLGTLIDYFTPLAEHQRVILIKSDGSTIRIPFTNKINFTQFQNLPVITTGSLDTCGQTLTVKDHSGIEMYYGK